MKMIHLQFICECLIMIDVKIVCVCLKEKTENAVLSLFVYVSTRAPKGLYLQTIITTGNVYVHIHNTHYVCTHTGAVRCVSTHA